MTVLHYQWAVKCCIISSTKASLSISFGLTITSTLNSLLTWFAYFWAFLYPAILKTQANPSKKWLQSQTKNQVECAKSGLGVASFTDARPFPNVWIWAKPGSVKASSVFRLVQYAILTWKKMPKTNKPIRPTERILILSTLLAMFL